MGAVTAHPKRFCLRLPNGKPRGIMDAEKAARQRQGCVGADSMNLKKGSGLSEKLCEIMRGKEADYVQGSYEDGQDQR